MIIKHKGNRRESRLGNKLHNLVKKTITRFKETESFQLDKDETAYKGVVILFQYFWRGL